MKNLYLNRMVFKPDYVVNYIGCNCSGNSYGYYGKAISENMYKNPKNRTYHITGYAASKSHPETPVLVSILVPMDTKYNNIDYKITVNKVDPVTFDMAEYTGKHDLYVYTLQHNAILAGKEMALYDEVNNMVDKCNDYIEPVTKYFDDVMKNSKYYNLAKDLAETFKQEVDKHVKNFEPTYNKAKEAAKKTYDKTKETVNSGISKLLDEMKKYDSDKCCKNCQNTQAQDCQLYNILTDRVAILLKQHTYNDVATYYLTVYDLNNKKNTKYNLTKEMFDDIFNILNTGDKGELKYNSIMDVINSNDVEEVKQNPIQFVNFRKEDTIKTDKKPSTQFTYKFTVGDKVIVKPTARVIRANYYGKVGVVEKIERSNRTYYYVKFVNNDAIEFYSDELEKYVEQQKNNTEKVNINYNYTTGTSNISDELKTRLDKHEQILEGLSHAFDIIKDNLK